MPVFEIDFEAIGRLPDSEREMAMAKAAEFLEAMKRNPLNAYNPYLQQAQLHDAAGVKTRAFFGGNRAGKTTAGVVDDLLEVVPRELIPAHLARWKRPEWRCPRYIRIGNVSNRESRSISLPKLQEYVPDALLPKGGWRRAFNRDDAMVQLECGCTIQLLSYEVERNKWGGAPLHRMHFDEEPPRELYEEGSARLVDFDGTELFTMTPLDGMTWMFDDVWLRSAADAKVFAVVASMLDNPALSRDGIVSAVEKYSAFPELLAARVYGRFVHFGGLVYPQWAQYRIRELDPAYVQACDVVVGIDPGARHFGLSWNAFDGRERQTQFASELISGDFHETRPGEVKLEGANVSHAVDAIHRVNRQWGIDQKAIDYVIDPSARSRSPITAATIETEFHNRGIYPQHAQAEPEAGVLLIRRKGQYGMFVTFDGPGNEAAQWEAERYRVEERKDGRFAVVKEDDHVMDATRYAASHRPWDPPPVAGKDDVVAMLQRAENRQPGIAVPPLRSAPEMAPEGPLV